MLFGILYNTVKNSQMIRYTQRVWFQVFNDSVASIYCTKGHKLKEILDCKQYLRKQYKNITFRRVICIS